MSGFVIKYNDIYNLLWEYKSKLEGLIENIELCENSINWFIETEKFQGEAATAIKSYMNDVHITILSSFKVTAQNLLDNIVLYKAGYYEIDNSTNFILPEEAIQAFRAKLCENGLNTETYGENVVGAISDISDIFSVNQPNTNQVLEIHDQLDQELINFVTAIETQESNTVKILENSTDLLITALQNCIGKIETTWTDINTYESNSFYTDVDAYALANLGQIFYQQHEDYQDAYTEIWEMEQGLKDAAEARETQGIWETIGGGLLIVTGVVCIVATGGASTPVVVAGWGIGGGTVAFGVADSVEGAQNIYYGSMGDIDSTAINQLKEVVFQGNEDAYYMAENIFAFMASAFIPISEAAKVGELTFRSGATAVVKEGISTVAGEGASRITMNLTGNQTASMIAGMMASNTTAHGLNGLDTRFDISGNRGTSFADMMSPADAAKYNQYWDDVAKGLDAETRIKLNQWNYRPDASLYIKYKDVYDNPKYFNQETGNVNYPGMNGDINLDGFKNGVYEIETLKPGTIIDRYGNNGSGKYFAPQGTSYEERALPPFMEDADYTQYKVVQPIEVKSGEVASWFEQPGGGIQYLSEYSVEELLDLGWIEEVK